jgi:hypothetical protein
MRPSSPLPVPLSHRDTYFTPTAKEDPAPPIRNAKAMRVGRYALAARLRQQWSSDLRHGLPELVLVLQIQIVLSYDRNRRALWKAYNQTAVPGGCGISSRMLVRIMRVRNSEQHLTARLR